MTNFDEAFQRLSSLTNYERLKPDPKHRLDLSGMTELCAALGDPQSSLGRVVQIAGSKGKGSVTAMLAAFGKQIGFRVGAYYSPHVRDVLERVRWDGRDASKEDFAASLALAADFIRPKQTWFEVFTAAAVHFFSTMNPELCVFEVGLGGRLDSTSVIPKELCAITQIELEHTHILGDTIEKVATEKAGILREGVPCITGAKGIALDCIRERARVVGAPLTVLDERIQVEIIGKDHRGFRLDLVLDGVPHEVLFPLHARVQVRNFCLALLLIDALVEGAAVQILGSAAHEDGLLWLADAMPPGRFQVVDADRPIIVDGSHTGASLKALAADLEESFPRRRFALVFGIAEGKHWQAGLSCLLRRVDRAYIAPLVGKVSEAPERLSAFCVENGVPGVPAASITEALRRAREELVDHGLLVAGSLYAAGEALECLEA